MPHSTLSIPPCYQSLVVRLNTSRLLFVFAAAVPHVVWQHALQHYKGTQLSPPLLVVFKRNRSAPNPQLALLPPRPKTAAAGNGGTAGAAAIPKPARYVPVDNHSIFCRITYNKYDLTNALPADALAQARNRRNYARELVLKSVVARAYGAEVLYMQHLIDTLQLHPHLCRPPHPGTLTTTVVFGFH